MAQSYLIFNFGSNEEAAQQARHTIDRWKQAFRLGKKVMMKFDRAGEDGGDTASEGAAPAAKDVVKGQEPETENAESAPGNAEAQADISGNGGKQQGKKRGAKQLQARQHADKEQEGEGAKGTDAGGDSEPATGQITLIVRLEFSDHERLSHQRWLARIPTEEPFKDARPRVVDKDDADFADVVE